MAQLPDDILAIVDDPYETMTRMDIEHREGPPVQFTNALWTPEQAMLGDDWWDHSKGALRHRETTTVKGRNQGVGLFTQAFVGAYALRCKDPIRILTIAHAEPTSKRHLDRYRSLLMGPALAAIRPTSSRDNDLLLRWSNGTEFIGATAGGKTGKAQGFTGQMLHVTECGMFPDAEDAQKTIGSLTATMHRASPHFWKHYESTSSGPGGWWQQHVLRAQRNPDHNFRFFPWSINPSFVLPFKDAAHRQKFIKSMGETEARVIQQHAAYLRDLAATRPRQYRWLERTYPQLLNMTPEALHWRRDKLANDYGELLHLFVHDYPMTVDEAFLSGGAGWFNPDYLSAAAMKALPGRHPQEKEGLPAAGEVWHEPDDWHRYVVGVDIGEGVGGDYSVICVLDHQLRQCFVWSDNRTPPEQVGELAVRVASTYGNALLLIESNKRGAEAIKAARKLGYERLYREKSKVSGSLKDFVTKGNQFHSNKELLFGHARTQMNKSRCELSDPLTISELTSIGIDGTGSINGRDKKHDDRAMAWVLAMWAAKRLEGFEVNQIESIVERFNLQDHGSRRTIPFG